MNNKILVTKIVYNTHIHFYMYYICFSNITTSVVMYGNVFENMKNFNIPFTYILNIKLLLKNYNNGEEKKR